jgi:mRNA interferase MazF
MTQTTGKYPKRGEIYWVSFDPSEGTEIKKTRPAVILSNDMFNKNLNRVIVAPITSNIERIFDFDCPITIEGKKGKIMIDQLRTIDKSRLKNKITLIDSAVLKKLEIALKITFEIS